MKKYKERQKQGLHIEDILIKGFGLSPSESYTSKYDAYFNGIPVNIKATKLKQNDQFSVDNSSLKNAYELDAPYIYFVLLTYKEKDEIMKIDLDTIKVGEFLNNGQKINFIKKHQGIKTLDIFKIPRMEWKNLFGYELVKTIMEDKEYMHYKVTSKEEQTRTKEEWKEWCSFFKSLYNKEEEYAFQPRFKRDSKGQCRIQCGITKKNIEDFLYKFKVENFKEEKMERLDKFYTTEKNVKKVLSLVDMDNYDKIVEPSAGNGSFLSFLPEEKTIAIDLKPEHPKIKEQDFFTYKEDSLGKVLVVGNPPFGKNSSIAVKFFNHAATFADTIVFILPKTFKKISIQNRLDLNFHLIEEVKIDQDFFVDGELKKVPTVLQRWEKKGIKREKIKTKKSTELFEFVKKEQADLAIRRVGWYAGKCYKDLNKAEVSHYFIKCKEPGKINEVYITLNELSWEHDNTAGSRSVSKHELIMNLENYIENKKKA